VKNKTGRKPESTEKRRRYFYYSKEDSPYFTATRKFFNGDIKIDAYNLERVTSETPSHSSASGCLANFRSNAFQRGSHFKENSRSAASIVDTVRTFPLSQTNQMERAGLFESDVRYSPEAQSISLMMRMCWNIAPVTDPACAKTSAFTRSASCNLEGADFVAPQATSSAAKIVSDAIRMCRSYMVNAYLYSVQSLCYFAITVILSSMILEIG